MYSLHERLRLASSRSVVGIYFSFFCVDEQYYYHSVTAVELAGDSQSQSDTSHTPFARLRKRSKIFTSFSRPNAKMLSASGVFARWPLDQRSAIGPCRVYSCPQTPVIRSCSTLAMLPHCPAPPENFLIIRPLVMGSILVIVIRIKQPDGLLSTKWSEREKDRLWWDWRKNRVDFKHVL